MTAFVFDDVKILDLTLEMGGYTSKLFADLGATVVKVEPPNGDTVRQKAPFYRNERHTEMSFHHLYLNVNKQSIILDIETNEGQQQLKELVKHFDVVIESFSPGYLSKLGLDYSVLSQLNPRLIMTSITPFGQTGPYKDYVANDLVGIAMGGLMYLGGYPDTSPLRPYGYQGYFAASLFGAVSTLLAIIQRERTSIGQYIDVSMQECVALALENAIQFYDLEGVVRKRTGSEDRQAGWGLYPCADGEVYIMTAGLSNAGGWDNLINWMIEEGVDEANALLEPIWQDHDFRATDEARAQFLNIFKQFTDDRKKLTLYEEGQKRKVPICPVSYLTDVLNNPQLKERDFFKEVIYENWNDKIVYTGPPYLFSDMQWALQKAAPSLGEDTEKIFKTYLSVEEGVEK